jgi:hypothetical protein
MKYVDGHKVHHHKAWPSRGTRQRLQLIAGDSQAVRSCSSYHQSVTVNNAGAAGASCAPFQISNKDRKSSMPNTNTLQSALKLSTAVEIAAMDEHC